jgi:hypothetical protein
MCGRVKTGKYPLQIQNIVNIVKYRQNMIANKFIFACALTDFGDAGGDSSSLP